MSGECSTAGRLEIPTYLSVSVCVVTNSETIYASLHHCLCSKSQSRDMMSGKASRLDSSTCCRQ